jgi:tetratricopeptide (TPR) repeat protein
MSGPPHMPSPAPSGKEQLADAIVRCIDDNDLARGLALSHDLNAHHPEYAYGWYLASFLMKKARRYVDALGSIERALRLSTADRYRLHRAKCLFEMGSIADARAAGGEMGDRDFDDPLLHSELGSLLHQLGEHVAALAQYDRALRHDGRNAGHHFNRAAVLRYLGDSEGAEAGFDAAIRINPAEYEAYNGRAHVRPQTRERNHVEELRRVIASTREPAGLVQLHFALAKELEDIGEYETAFDNLSAGAGIKRRHMQYSVETDLQIISKIRETFGPGMFDGHIQGFGSADPIFIVGMPRTGTTLVERILGSHSAVVSAGELNHFSLTLIPLVRKLAGPKRPSRLEFVEASAHVDFRALGEAYLAATRPLRDERPRFIDKLPFNFLYAGLIHLALPKAKIVNLQRHPMDTCFAVFKQLFRDAYPFSYDLDELGQYYIAYHRLMQHWNAVMPGVIHTIRYEALVADVESESRRLLEFCDLPWEDQCLRFHENRQASTTASALQVRQPVYASSVGKWRHHQRQLAPLQRRLEDAGIDTR